MRQAWRQPEARGILPVPIPGANLTQGYEALADVSRDHIENDEATSPPRLGEARSQSTIDSNVPQLQDDVVSTI